jgi:hypothetical protein
VRLPLADDAAPTSERPTIGAVTLRTASAAAPDPAAPPPEPVSTSGPAAAPAAFSAPDAAPMAGDIAPAAESPSAGLAAALEPQLSASAPPSLAPVAQSATPAVDPTSQLRRDLADALAAFGALLKQALASETIEVATYAGDDPGGARYDAAQGGFVGAGAPHILTRVGPAGDVATYVARRDGKVDENLADLHGALAQQAQAQRAELIAALAASAGELIAALKTL